MHHIARLVCFAVIFSSAGARADTTTNPFPGGTLVHTDNGTQDLWVLRMDLCTPGVSVRTTADGERGRTVPSFSNLVGAQAAVNGDFFGGNFSTDGPAAHDAGFWGAGVDHTYVAPISFGPAHIEIPHHNNTTGPAAWAKEVVSGHPTLLDDGTVVGNPGDPLCTNRHPRTAVGISQDHRTLIIAVVDGRRSGAAGMTCDELAFVMAANGAFDAVNMDGGGSSTMVINGAVKNVPSDGSPRTVGNHLAVFASGSGPAPQCPDFVDPVCGGNANQQSCDGTVVTSCSEGAPVAHGDCGFFGAGCSTEGGTGHCVHPYCLLNLDGGETGAFCMDDTHLGTCDLGVYGEGDCGFFGAKCGEEGGSGHCVHFNCWTNLDGAETGSFCVNETTRGVCNQGVYEEVACGADACQENSTTAASCGATSSEGEGEGEGEPSEGEGEGEEGEGEGDASEGEGEGDASEGEGEGEGESHKFAPSTDDEGSCASAPIGSLAVALVVLARRRSRSP